MSEELIPEQLSLDEQIDNKLVKANVTEAVIADLRERYLPLKIAGIEDKETYLLVKEGRKNCKAIRVMAKKICTDGREDAVAIQKKWVAKEKEVTSRIAEVEDYLEEQEKAYEAEVAAEKEARKRKQEEQLIMRQQVLSGMGALYSDGSFTLGEVSFEFSAIKESEDDIWEESILPKFKDEWYKIQAEQLLQEQERQKKEAELKRQQEELEQKKKELALEAARLNEEAERQAAAAQKAREDKELARADQLFALGLKFDAVDHYVGYDCFVPLLDIRCHSDEKWNKLIIGVTERVNLKKAEEAEEKRKEQERIELQNKRYAELLPFKEYGHQVGMDELWVLSEDQFSAALSSKKAEKDRVENEKAKEIAEKAAKAERERIEEEQRQAEIKRKDDLRISRLAMLKEHDLTHPVKDSMLGEISEEAWMNDFTELKAHRDEIIRKQEEERKAEELAKAGDKEKWNEIMERVEAIEVYAMRSSQYRKKAAILREKLEEIKAL